MNVDPFRRRPGSIDSGVRRALSNARTRAFVRSDRSLCAFQISSLKPTPRVCPADSVNATLLPSNVPIRRVALNIPHFGLRSAEYRRYEVDTEVVRKRILQSIRLSHSLEESLGLVAVNSIRVRRVAREQGRERPLLQIALKAIGVIFRDSQQSSHFPQTLRGDLTVDRLKAAGLKCSRRSPQRDSSRTANPWKQSSSSETAR